MGKILDKDFEAGITGRLDEIQKDAQGNITMAQNYAYKRNDEIEAMIKEHPKAFVLGSFVGGFALGTLLARSNK